MRQPICVRWDLAQKDKLPEKKEHERGHNSYSQNVLEGALRWTFTFGLAIGKVVHNSRNVSVYSSRFSNEESTPLILPAYVVSSVPNPSARLIT